jgi:molybdopterin-containing oxidoreductase family iron-sulfur binding subunit
MEDEKDNKARREFLKFGLIAGGATLAGIGINKNLSGESPPESGVKEKVLTADGKLVEVDSAHLKHSSHHHHSVAVAETEARKGIPGKRYVMVIDLSRCKHALKCQKACSKHHYLDDHEKYIKIFKMQNNDLASPYWMPKPCLHCDNPPCTKVCPVDATFKREDGIVLIDNERCIGCRFCMAACPYSTRTFNWTEPNQPEEVKNMEYNMEAGLPRKKGTVEKCDFCPDMLREGKLPHCVTACPNSVFLFGDENEDAVTNGSETFVLSQLLKDKGAYRYMEELGTKPRVYYLPPVDRLFPFKDAEETATGDAK